LGSIWASLILVEIAIYVWATVVFGPRFSNLTNRGIITNGPYRWTKHPAYTFKIAAYAMINLPFVHPDTWLDAMRSMIMFTVLALIYYMRAKAEEAYLMKDPVYRDYAEWIDRNGAWARLKRLVWAGRGNVSGER